MTIRRWLGLAMCCLLALALGPAHRLQAQQPPTAAQNTQPDLGAFVMELMDFKVNGDMTQMAMWLPTKFFIIAAENGGATRPVVEAAGEALDPYLVVAVQVSTEHNRNQKTFQAEADVRARAGLKLADGTVVRPLTDIPNNLLKFVHNVKTSLATKDDPKGEHMVILFFPSTTAQGKRVVDSATKGQLTVGLKAAQGYPLAFFTWHTPFDALTPAAPCTKCQGELSAKWSYCPWCGQAIP